MRPRARNYFILLIALTAALCIPETGLAAPPGTEDVQRLRQVIERYCKAWYLQAPKVDRGYPLRDLDVLMRECYLQREHRPAWTEEAARDLLRVIRDAEADGLNPGDYRSERIETLLPYFGGDTGEGNLERRALLDILLTETFLVYGRHLAMGRIDPSRTFYQWAPTRRQHNMPRAFSEAVEGGDIAGALRKLAPEHPGYGQMRNELNTLRHIAAAGGWPAIPGTRLKRGNRSHRVPFLRERLILGGDLQNTDPKGDERVFDANLEAAVRQFQIRHGLPPTGMADTDTLNAMNVPASERLRQMALNLERWRWLPDDFGPRYLLVMIPDCWLFGVENGQTALSMKTVMGAPKTPSPIFSHQMSYLELNPLWGLPNSIIAREILPKVRKDPEYLNKKRIRILENWGEGARPIDPETIDWSRVNPERFPYLMVQDAGVNPLGRIKFMFPNTFDVYLHDTTEKHLFKRRWRFYSHGCIRVEKPYDLALWLLQGDPVWDRDRLVESVKKRKRLKVFLPSAVPVHILYFTAWVDGNGLSQYRRDIYGYDKIQDAALGMRSTPFTGADTVSLLVRPTPARAFRAPER